MEIDQILIIGFIAGVAGMSAYFQLLKPSGAFAAFLTGILIWAGFGFKGMILLGVFFLTSSLLSKYKSQRKEQLGELHEKGSARDWAQVAANGGTAALAGLANFISPDPVWFIVLASSLASANGDTWASELGVLSKVQPLSIKSFKRVPRGTSGAISIVGTASAAAGSLLIALIADYLFKLGAGWTVAVFLLGVTGTMVDTWLGAYLQAGFACAKCNLLTEKTTHCSEPTRHVSGLVMMNNDAVNFLSCFTAAMGGMLLYSIL
ncbi:DUF92 domain-containing protein [Bacillus sp. ISL-35]|uniref:DUF92 domain-containing protein n=1 Tax=Bacillus sp. ISL-35 TaxID=2819122 RepID=UPI001BE688B8|nr:DUF92 domain-containing protein [Bacillus sp. ISL-35]MBT2677502.1 DUF92 domain-containing protein [Bacillus sp. ISL-35]MBT2702110.1 DUF92 domain-containing protein [Chryseobacterium sp. ISL-80]